MEKINIINYKGNSIILIHNIGDKLFFFYDGKIHEAVIEDIRICYNIYYTFTVNSLGYNCIALNEYPLRIATNNGRFLLYKSKEELIQKEKLLKP